MADLTGALEAIEDRLSANWTTTGISFENEDVAAKVDGNGQPIPWVLLETEIDEARPAGFGMPASRLYREWGSVRVLVFVPINRGRKLARQHAVAIGEIYRMARFYDASPETYVRTYTPRVGRGQEAVSENPKGKWWCVSVSTPFEFYHRA